MNAAQLARALDSKAIGSGSAWSCRCPAHDDRTPSLSIRDGDSGILLCCHAGCDRRDIIAELQRRGLWQGRGEWPVSRPAKLASKRRDPEPVPNTLSPAVQAALRRWGQADWSPPTEPHRNTAHVKTIWGTADEIITGTPAENYLRRRHLWPDDDDVSAFYPWAKLRCALDPLALVVAINDPVGNLVAVHRVFLTADGRKAAIEKPKTSLGPLRGNAARLADWRETDTLALTEGVEDALAFMKLTGTPTWAACGAGMIASMILPTAIRNVVIVADADQRGMAAAGEALRNFSGQGRSLRVVRPIGAKDAAEVLERMPA